MDKKHTQISRFLSFILRHNPESIGLKLDSNGWASVAELIELAEHKGNRLTKDLIDHIVENNNKQRFSLSSDGQKIRANQGHSIPIDLNLQQEIPPEFLYHGTATRFLDAISMEGLKPVGRHHVHMSGNADTAREVGRRHGKPVVLKILALTMNADGYKFYQSENRVWLTDAVPVIYIETLPDIVFD